MAEETIKEQQAPTKDEVIKFLQEQIEVKTVQLQLQELNAKLAVSKAEEFKALQFIAQIQGQQQKDSTNSPYQGQGGTPYTITQEDLDANPELVQEGIAVGDQVLIPHPEELAKADEDEKVKSSRTLKKK